MHFSIITLDDDGGLIVGGALLIEYRQDDSLLAPEKDGIFLVHSTMVYNHLRLDGASYMNIVTIKYITSEYPFKRNFSSRVTFLCYLLNAKQLSREKKKGKQAA